MIKANIKIGFAKTVAVFCILLSGPAIAQDPFTSNNGLYPTSDNYSGRFLTANLNYPSKPGANDWPIDKSNGPLSVENASEYAARLLAHLAPQFRTLVNDNANWDPVAAEWYDMVWLGSGSSDSSGATDPNSGREALMNTYSGQVLPATTFSPEFRPTAPVQNHALIYYNSTAATMLSNMWDNVYSPALEKADFPDGSIVAKVEAVTNTPENWSVLKGSAQWEVFRPTTESIEKGGTLTAEVLPVRPFQMAVRVKDSFASPKTGWVFALFVYDANAQGDTPFDRFVPMGLQWGNDPEFAQDKNGIPNGETLSETWMNPNGPGFIQDTVGWGGRLAGPMDVATRENVVTTSGVRYQGDNNIKVSSCQSCHGSSEFPFTANLYPSPNKSFPPDGETFLLYDPGSPEWAEWFQNRKGTEAMSRSIGGQGLDYDMALMFAVSAFNAAMGNDGFVLKRFDVH